MGITIVQKSDLKTRKHRSEDRARARRRRRHRRRLQARRPEGARRLPRQPQDHRVRHLRRPLRRRRARRAARRRHQPGRDDQEPRGQVDRAHALSRASTSTAPTCASSSSGRCEYALAPVARSCRGRSPTWCAARPKLAERAAARAAPTICASRRRSDATTLLTPDRRRDLGTGARFPSLLDHLPTGFFDNASIERYVRRNLERAGLTNDFRTLYRRTKRELYISAMNLDTAERVVFGHDEDASVTISEAVQASTALPGFYKPARIKGVDYVDGGVRRTANIDVAIEHGADLVICYNPFRPVLEPRAAPLRPRARHVHLRRHAAGRRRRAQRPQPGVPHAAALAPPVRPARVPGRSELPGRHHRHRAEGDPTSTSSSSTRCRTGSACAPPSSATRRSPSRSSATTTWSSPILERYGLTMTRREVRDGIGRIRDDDLAEATQVLTREVPRRDLSVA